MASQIGYRPPPESRMAIQSGIVSFVGRAGTAETTEALTALLVGHLHGLEVTRAAYIRLGCAGQAVRPVRVFGDDARQFLERPDLDAIIAAVFSVAQPFVWAPVYPTRVVEIEAAVRPASIIAPVAGSQGSLGLVWAATHRRQPFNLSEQSMIAAAAAAYATTGLVLAAAPQEGPPRLTRRERECLAWAAEGKSDWVIAEILALARSTVHTHIENAKRKLGATSRLEAILRAWRSGLLVAR